MAWNDERVELLKKLWADGLSASQIASRLGGVTRNAVIGKVHRLGLSGARQARAPRARGRAGPMPRGSTRAFTRCSAHAATPRSRRSYEDRAGTNAG